MSPCLEIQAEFKFCWKRYVTKVFCVNPIFVKMQEGKSCSFELFQIDTCEELYCVSVIWKHYIYLNVEYKRTVTLSLWHKQ